jgi:hypothetical protein
MLPGLVALTQIDPLQRTFGIILVTCICYRKTQIRNKNCCDIFSFFHIFYLENFRLVIP